MNETFEEVICRKVTGFSRFKVCSWSIFCSCIKEAKKQTAKEICDKLRNSNLDIDEFTIKQLEELQ